MSAPANPEALKKLQEAADKILAADDWVTSTLPQSFTPISMEEKLSSEDILKLAGRTPLPPKKP